MHLGIIRYKFYTLNIPKNINFTKSGQGDFLEVVDSYILVEKNMSASFDGRQYN